jgi:type IV pilus assembly protein PilW
LPSIYKPSPQSQFGFSLVEIMVGLVIGILGVIVMLQVFALSEERKRTTTNTGESQSDGVIALYQLQRDIGQAGYGFTSQGLFACNLTAPSGTTAIPLAPVIVNPPTAVIPAADANTDRLLVLYGEGNGQPQGNPIASQLSNVYTVQMPTAFAVDDRVIAAPAACAANLILDRVMASAGTVTVATGAAGATLYNLGPRPKLMAYAVRSGNLTVCDYVVNDCGTASTTNTTIWVPIASNIVSLKVQYGRDTLTTSPVPSPPAMPNPPVDQTVYAKAVTYDQTTPSGASAACNWLRIPAVRLALVARSGQYDKGVITAAEPVWSGTATNPIVLSAFTNWQHYRYKVFQTVVPIRNVAWMGVPVGC